MLPTRDEAKALLRAGARTNPGLWTAHSACVAHCARVIAEAAGLDGEKAYILGLLHDIGKSERVCALYHVWLGWRQMNELGYGEAARICLTHSFQVQDLDSFMGQRDVTDAQYAQLERELAAVEYDEYDRLIQLCDAVGDGRPVVIEPRPGAADGGQMAGRAGAEKTVRQGLRPGHLPAAARASLTCPWGGPQAAGPGIKKTGPRSFRGPVFVLIGAARPSLRRVCPRQGALTRVTQYAALWPRGES